MKRFALFVRLYVCGEPIFLQKEILPTIPTTIKERKGTVSASPARPSTRVTPEARTASIGDGRCTVQASNTSGINPTNAVRKHVRAVLIYQRILERFSCERSRTIRAESLTTIISLR